MKKLIPLFFLTSLFAPFWGGYSLLNYRKKQLKRSIKHQMIDGIDRTKLVKFTFSISDSREKLKWEHSKEFEYHGEMYDVVEQEKKGDSVTYWLWWDRKETALNQKLYALLAGFMKQDSQRKNQKQTLIDFAKKLFASEIPLHELNPEFKTTEKSIFRYCISSLIINTLPPTPPPKL